MTNEEVSLNTKKALANTLKELMKTKSFSKITISEIIRQCNVNRKTFYYHFEDIYALLKWMLDQEAIEVVRQFNLPYNCTDALSFIYDYVNNNSYILNCAYDSIGRDTLKRIFCDDIVDIMDSTITHTEIDLNCHLPESFHKFLCMFYTEGIVGMLVSMFQNPNTISKENAINYFSKIITNSIPAAVKSYGESLS